MEEGENWRIRNFPGKANIIQVYAKFQNIFTEEVEDDDVNIKLHRLFSDNHCQREAHLLSSKRVIVESSIATAASSYFLVLETGIYYLPPQFSEIYFIFHLLVLLPLGFVDLSVA